jgi:hypothetical protein
MLDNTAGFLDPAQTHPAAPVQEINKHFPVNNLGSTFYDYQIVQLVSLFRAETGGLTLTPGDGEVTSPPLPAISVYNMDKLI